MQLRRTLLALAIGTATACFTILASAQQVYKWKDANGVTHFSQTPPTSTTHYTKMHLQGQPDVTTPSTSAPSSQQDQANDEDQGPQARSGNTPRTEEDTPDNRTKLCNQLRANISLLESKKPVVTTGNNGKQRVMSDDAREQQLATARAQQTQYCVSKGG